MNGFLNFLRSVYVIKRNIPDTKITIKVPTKSKPHKNSTLTRLLPFIMFLGMFLGFSIISSIINSGKVTGGSLFGGMGFMVFSMLASALSGIIVAKIQKKNIENEEKEIFDEWIEELEDTEESLKSDYNHRLQYLNNCFYSSESALLSVIENKTPYLWNVAESHSDFLSESIGTSQIDSGIEVVVEGKTKHLDESQNRLLNRVATTYATFNKAPYCIDLTQSTCIGVYGNNSFNFIRSFVMKLFMRHGYDLLKGVLICNKNNYPEMSWMRWLPHLWDDVKSNRFILNNIYNSKENEILREYIVKEIAKYNDGYLLPYYVFVVAEKSDVYGSALFREIQNLVSVGRASIIIAGDKKNDLPAFCTTVIDATRSNAVLYDAEHPDGKGQLFHIDDISLRTAERMSREMSRVLLIDSPNNSKIPHVIGFLDMLFSDGIFDRNLSLHDNIFSRWQKAPLPAKQKVLFGAIEDGKPYTLEINQFNFKHMILAGRARSGKSQFLMSFIAYLMVNYPPNHVKFLFLDFKGAALSTSFENAPHCAGAFSDLDNGSKSNINRLKEMLVAEISRREAIFKKTDIQPKDVETYNAVMRERGSSELIPHLFIVVDEYVELLSSHPDFTAIFEKVSHVGASSGIHLILASQRLDSSVGPQIQTNVDVSICFKVNTNEESKAMVGHAGAKSITIPGRGFVKTDRAVIEFQAPWIEKPYTPYAFESRQDIYRVLPNGQRVSHKKSDADIVIVRESELQRLTKTLGEMKKEIAKKYPHVLAQIFTPPLPEAVFWDSKKLQAMLANEVRQAENRLKNIALIGVADDFTKHRHLPGFINLSGNHYFIAGAAKTGKTNLLKTIIYSASMMCAPNHLNFYICDFGGNEFKPLLQLPQVHNGIINNFEQLFRLFNFLDTTIYERREKFGDHFADISEYRKAFPDENLPDIVVVIDDADNLNDYLLEIVKSEVLNDKISSLIANSAERYGVSFIISSKDCMSSKRLLRSFNNRISLYYGDDTASSLMGAPKELTLEKITGRCYAYFEERLLITQVIGFPSDSEYTVAQKTASIIEESIKQQPDGWKLYSVPPIIPRVISQPISNLQRNKRNLNAKIPLFVDNATNTPVFLEDQNMGSLFVLGKKEHCSHYIRTIIMQALSCDMEVHIVDLSESVTLAENDNLYVYNADNLDSLYGGGGKVGMLSDNYRTDKEQLLITTDITDLIELAAKGPQGMGGKTMLNNLLAEIYNVEGRSNRYWIATDRFQNIQPSHERNLISRQPCGQAFAMSTKSIEIACWREVSPRHISLLDIEYLNSDLPDNQAWFCFRGAFSRVVLPSPF